LAIIPTFIFAVRCYYSLAKAASFLKITYSPAEPLPPLTIHIRSTNR